MVCCNISNFPQGVEVIWLYDINKISQNMMINKVNDSLHYWIIGNVFS